MIVKLVKLQETEASCKHHPNIKGRGLDGMSDWLHLLSLSEAPRRRY